MSGGLVLRRQPIKGKDLAILTYEQMTDGVEVKKKTNPPEPMTLDCCTEDVNAKQRRVPIPIYPIPLTDMTGDSEIPKPAPLVQQTLKLKARNRYH